jgi:hypothetical protein
VNRLFPECRYFAESWLVGGKGLIRHRSLLGFSHQNEKEATCDFTSLLKAPSFSMPEFTGTDFSSTGSLFSSPIPGAQNFR